MALTTTYNLTALTGEFRTNTFLDGNQIRPDVLGLTNGGFVSAYINTPTELFLNFYDSAYQPIGGHVIPFESSAGVVGQPSLTQLTNGNVLVVWDDNISGDTGLRGRMLSATGTLIGTELDLVNQTQTLATGEVKVVALANGGFLLTSTQNDNIAWNRFNAAGVLQASGAVTTGEDDSRADSAVAALTDGGFVITYSLTRFISFARETHEVRAVVFNADGTVRKADFFIDGGGPDDEFFQSSELASLPGGGFALVYQDDNRTHEGNENGTFGITLRVFNSAGTAIDGGPVKVNNTSPAANERDPDVTVLANGFIVVTWTRDSDNSDIFGRVFDPTGVPVTVNGVTGEFLIRNSGEVFDDVASAVSRILAGQFVTSWQENIPGDGFGGQITSRVDEVTRTTMGDGAADVFNGDELRDIVNGGGGNDTLNGNGGVDLLIGGPGGDTFQLLDVSLSGGVYVYDTVQEDTGGGIDTVQVVRSSLASAPTLYVLPANVENGVIQGTLALDLTGNASDNHLTGNAAANTLRGLGGANVLEGGGGSDTYVLEGVHQITDLDGLVSVVYDDVIEAAGAGTDTVRVQRISGISNPTLYTLPANVEHGIIEGTSAFNLTGNAADNHLTGNDASNTLRGLGGADLLEGKGGNDTYFLDNVHQITDIEGLVLIVYDDVVEAVGGGTDTVHVQRVSGITNPTLYTLPANVENGFIDGTTAFNLNGNELENSLTGNSASNTFRGFAGNDTIDGGGGTDTARFAGLRASYTIVRGPGGTVNVIGADGSDTLTSVERLQFDDQTVGSSLTPNDFNGDGRSDVLFSQQGAVYASNYEWQMNDRAISGQGAIDLYDKAFTDQVIGDYDGDGKADVVFHNPTTGGVWMWLLDGTTIASQGAVDVADPSYHLLGSADFNGDGRDDLLFRNDAGFIYQWQMNGRINTPVPVQALDPSWHVVGAGDFDRDGNADLLLRNISNSASENGAYFLWKMDGNQIIGQGGIERPPTAWKTFAVGDFDGDGRTDFAVRNQSATSDNGAVWVYLMDGTTIKSQGAAGIADPNVWHVQEVGDFNGDGRDDILMRNDTGYFYSWDMNGTTVQSEGLAGTQAGNWADPALHVVTQHWDLV